MTALRGVRRLILSRLILSDADRRRRRVKDEANAREVQRARLKYQIFASPGREGATRC
jgi:hypothetical protein